LHTQAKRQPGWQDSEKTSGTLLPVIEIIPESCYDNPVWKGLGYFARDLLVYGLILFGLASTDHILLLIPLWVLSGFAVSALFIVGHDAAHAALFKSKRLNGVIGRLAMLPSLHIFEAWVLGHNRIHHAHTVRQGMDFVWHPLTPTEFEALSPAAKRMHKIEWSSAGTGIYYLREIWWRKMVFFTPPKKWVRRIQRDSWIVRGFALVATATLFTLGWSQYGSLLGAFWLWCKLLVIPFVLFCYVIGWVVHVHHISETIQWRKRKEWTKYQGQMEGTTILHAPAWLNFFVHWIFVHVPHHVDMRIPMYKLKEASESIIEHFPGVIEERPLRLRDFVKNAKACKLYDFEAGEWLTYKEAAEMVSQKTATAA